MTSAGQVASVGLEPPTGRNRQAILALELLPGQRDFVAPNADSLEEAREDGEAIPRAVIADGRVVGFLMYEAPIDDDEATLYRFMIDGEDLAAFKEELFAEMRIIINHSHSQQKRWLKTDEVRKLLKVSPGTLQTLRVNGTLAYSKIGSVMLRVIVSASVAASMTRSAPARSAMLGAAEMRAMASLRACSSSLPEPTCLAMLPLMVAMPFSMRSGEIS